MARNLCSVVVAAQNFTGYCQRLVTSDLDEAARIFDAGRQAAALNRADRRIAKDVPVVPLFQHPIYARPRARRSRFRLQQHHRRLGGGELVARGVALAAALAVSLLAVSGAGGAGAQTPKRGGTITIPRPEVQCFNPFTCGFYPAMLEVLEGAFEVGPDLVFRPNLVTRVEIGRKPFTLTYHVRPEARWSDGAPVTASDFQFTHRMFAELETPDTPRRAFYRMVRRADVIDAKTFRVELQRAVRELALVVRGRATASCARGRGHGEGLDRPDRQSEDRQADRQRAVPRRQLGARQAARRSSGTLATGGRTRPTSIVSSAASRGRTRAIRSARSGGARSTSPSASEAVS